MSRPSYPGGLSSGRDPEDFSEAERQLGRLLHRPPPPKARERVLAAFLAGGHAETDHCASQGGSGPRSGRPAPGSGAHSPTQFSSSDPDRALNANDQNPERLRALWPRPTARDGFRADLRERFVSGAWGPEQIDAPSATPGRILTDERLRGRWSRLRPALLAAAAAVLVTVGVQLLGPAAPPTWRVMSEQASIAEATYLGEPLTHRASLSPNGELFAGTSSLRLGLECQRGISLHLGATPGTQAFIREARWLDEECMQSELALQGEGELLLISGCATGPSVSVADRVEANVETPEGNVRFLGGALSIKRSSAGVSVVLEHGRAEIQTTGRDTIILEPGAQVLIRADGELVQDLHYFEKHDTDKAIADRLAPLRVAQADLAEGIF